ncbi:MAG TPA: hypothetical protein VG122_12715 [Gemmata sp.]|jgi:hypothetical protein|nr:hypothetical protein [Gemmata sp.]
MCELHRSVDGVIVFDIVSETVTNVVAVSAAILPYNARFVLLADRDCFD